MFIWLALVGLAIACEPVFGQFSDVKPLNPKLTPFHKRLPEPLPESVVEWGKSSRSIQTALAHVADRPTQSVVTLVSSNGRTSLGTVVADRLIVAKKTEIDPQTKVVISGRTGQGQIVATYPQFDLALVETDLEDLLPINFPEQARVAEQGTMVVSIGVKNSDANLGLITVKPQVFYIQQPTCDDCVDFGLVLASNLKIHSVVVSDPNSPNPGRTIMYQGLEVERVYPRSVAERCGLLVGDYMLTINNQFFPTPAQFNTYARTLKTGEQVQVYVIRDGELKSLSTIVHHKTARTVYDRWGGGPFSQRRFGFGQVITHDTILPPELCGGPLVDLEGTLVGINIARSMRVASFAVSPQEIESLIRAYRPSVQLNYNQNLPVNSNQKDVASDSQSSD